MAALPSTTGDSQNTDSCSSIDSSDSMLPTGLTIKQQAEVIKLCSDDIHALLDLEQIFPHLYQGNLLTDSEEESLQSTNSHWSRKRKISMLVMSLPRKGSEVLGRFHECLMRSANGTAHMELANILLKKAKEVAAAHKDNYIRISNRCTLSRSQIVAALVCLPVSIGMMFLWSYFPVLKHQFNLLHSESLPYSSENFVGRDQEMHELLDLLNFEQSDIRIVNIIGSPGFGKSTLAIHVGHRLMDSGVVVHYVNMGDLEQLDQSVDQLLAEKVLQSSGTIAKRVTFDRLEKWARERFWYNLIILDNCDDALNQQQDIFQTAVDKLVKNSLRVKVLMTSREVTLFLDYFRSYNLYEISTKAACHLLKLKVPVTVGLNKTQEEKIAKLTGNVPLALQIVSSLLELPSSPSPNTIIEELERGPIAVLSPKELHSSQQINASISLSFKYLSPQLRIAGQFHANFPGSFSETAAYSVILLSSQTNLHLDEVLVQTLKQELDSLVRRSLLGYNRRTGRYQFHRLIREYFLETQKINKETHLANIKKFCASFYIYYASLMIELSEEFSTNHYVKSLTTFDTERHNFQLLLEYLKEPKLVLHRRAFVCVIYAVSQALNSGLIFCRFTCEELIEPLKNGLDYLHKQSELFWSYFNNYPEVISGSTFYESLFPLVSHLAECMGNSNQTEAKLNVFLDYKNIFDSKRPDTSSTVYIYTRFYETLASYYLKLDMQSEYIECYRILLEQSKEQRAGCEPGTCKYRNIGFAYAAIGESIGAVHFLEQSLQQNELEAFSQVYALCILHTHYDKLSDEKMMLKTKERLYYFLSSDFQTVPDIRLYKSSRMTASIISKLREIEMKQEALEVEERLLQVIRTIGASPERAVSLQQAFNAVKQLYDLGNYSSAADLGQFTLNSFLQSMDDEQRENSELTILQFQLLIGLAKFHGRNYSDGWNDIEEVLTTMFTQPNPNAEILSIACLYLIPRFKYINKCYNITERIYAQPLAAGVFVFRILFYPLLDISFSDIILDQQIVTASPSTMSINPAIGFLSSSTDVSTTSLTGNEITDFLVEKIFQFSSVIDDYLYMQLSYAKECAETLVRHPVFRLVVYILLVGWRIFFYLKICVVIIADYNKIILLQFRYSYIIVNCLFKSCYCCSNIMCCLVPQLCLCFLLYYTYL